jgi:hypothetical protein
MRVQVQTLVRLMKARAEAFAQWWAASGAEEYRREQATTELAAVHTNTGAPVEVGRINTGFDRAPKQPRRGVAAEHGQRIDEALAAARSTRSSDWRRKTTAAGVVRYFAVASIRIEDIQ